MRTVATLVLDDERVPVPLRHQRLEELRPVAGVAAAEARKPRLVVEPVPVSALLVRGELGKTGLLLKRSVDTLTREETSPVDGFGVVREVARAFDVDTTELPEVHRIDDIRRIDVLPDVMRRVVGLLQVGVVVQYGIHQLAGRKTARQVAVAGGGRRRHPPFHRAVFDAQGDPEALGVLEDGRKDLLELLEILLEAAILGRQRLIVADKRAADDVVGVAAEHRRDADQLQDVVLIDNLELWLAADEVVVGADGDAKPLLVADLDHLLRALGREVVVVEMRRDVVLAVRVAAEDAELEALRPDALRALDDGLEVRIGCERARHEPNRVVAGLRLRRMGQRLRRGHSNRGQRRGALEKLSPCCRYQSPSSRARA